MTWAIEEKGYSQRRACGLIGMEPKTYRYASSRADDAGLRTRLRALAAERRRFGYRRLHILLRREGVTLNHKKLFRLYREEKLTVKRRGGRKRALGTRAPMTLPQGPNQRWSLDFVSDRVALHRARQAHPERLRREPERALPGRVLERAPLPERADSPPYRRGLADRLQSPPAAHEPRRPHPERVRNPVHTGPEPERTLVMNGGNQGARSTSP